MRSTPAPVPTLPQPPVTPRVGPARVAGPVALAVATVLVVGGCRSGRDGGAGPSGAGGSATLAEPSTRPSTDAGRGDERATSTRPAASADRLDNDDSTVGEGLFSRAASAGGGLVLTVGRTPGRIYNAVASAVTGKPTYTREDAAARLADKDFPDERRVGINQLVTLDGGREGSATDAYAALASADGDPIVRATAIRALNRARDGSATGTFVAALADADPMVRLEAAKALNNLPAASAQAPLIARLNDPAEDRDVRIAAAEALRHYKSIDAARALVGTLNGREFGVSWQARRSLRAMAGADFRYDEPAWLAYLTGPSDPLG